MEHQTPRGLPTPPELSERLRSIISEHPNPREAAEALGLARNTLIALAAGCAALEGTITVASARVREYDARRAKTAPRLRLVGPEPLGSVLGRVFEGMADAVRNGEES